MRTTNRVEKSASATYGPVPVASPQTRMRGRGQKKHPPDEPEAVEPRSSKTKPTRIMPIATRNMMD